MTHTFVKVTLLNIFNFRYKISRSFLICKTVSEKLFTNHSNIKYLYLGTEYVMIEFIRLEIYKDLDVLNYTEDKKYVWTVDRISLIAELHLRLE